MILVKSNYFDIYVGTILYYWKSTTKTYLLLLQNSYLNTRTLGQYLVTYISKCLLIYLLLK